MNHIDLNQLTGADLASAPKPALCDQPEAIRRFLLENIPEHPRAVVALATHRFGVNRTTVYRHLKSMVAEKIVLKTGHTSGARYYLKESLNRNFSLPLRPDLKEARVWGEHLHGTFQLLPENVFDIFRYGFSRMFQNVLDHSESQRIFIRALWGEDDLTLELVDHGVGIFNRLTSIWNIEDERECIAKLARGKITSDPNEHAGQGLFFTSCAVDRFHLWSGYLHYYRDAIEDDWHMERRPECLAGTGVALTVRYDCPRKITEVFAKYATLQEEPDPHFDRIHLQASLCAGEGAESPVLTRAMARKLLRGAEKYRHVQVDFNNVFIVTQGFVDQVFRLFPARHPGIHLEYCNANEDIDFMIQRRDLAGPEGI